MSDNKEVMSADVVLVGAGIMSTTLAVFLKELQPHARELGSDRELEGIAEILSRGNGADRQLRVFNANRDIAEVVEEIAKATEAVPEAV